MLDKIKKKVGAQFGNKNAARNKGAIAGGLIGAKGAAALGFTTARNFERAQGIAKSSRLAKTVLGAAAVGALAGSATGALVGMGVKKVKERKK